MRKTYVIDREFQIKFIIRFCAVVVVAAVMLAAIVLWFSDNSTTVTIENTRIGVKNTVDFIYPIIFQSFIVAAVFSAVCVAVLTMLMTHKIAGPLYRLRRDIEKIKDGDLRVEFKIRKGDQVGEFAQALGDTIRSLRSRIGEVSDRADELVNKIDVSTADRDIRDAAAVLKEKLSEIKL